MATQSQRPPRDVVEFAPNVPVTVALKYNQGRRCNSQYGERMMYSTTDGRVMFLDIETAAQVEALGINVGESFKRHQEMERFDRLARNVGNFAGPRRAAQWNVSGSGRRGDDRRRGPQARGEFHPAAPPEKTGE